MNARRLNIRVFSLACVSKIQKTTCKKMMSRCCPERGIRNNSDQAWRLYTAPYNEKRLNVSRPFGTQCLGYFDIMRALVALYKQKKLGWSNRCIGHAWFTLNRTYDHWTIKYRRWSGLWSSNNHTQKMASIVITHRRWSASLRSNTHIVEQQQSHTEDGHPYH